MTTKKKKKTPIPYFLTTSHLRNSLKNINQQTQIKYPPPSLSGHPQSQHSKSLKATSDKSSRKANAELDALLEKVGSAVVAARNGLVGMKDGIAQSKGKSAEKEIQNNMHALLTSKFQELLEKFNGIQMAYKGKVEDDAARQMKTVNPFVSDKEVANAIASGDFSGVFAQALTSSEDHRAKEALIMVKERYREIRNIERNIVEMRSIFSEMTTLVQSQHEMVQEIDYKVQASLKFTEEGVEDLKAAQELQAAAQKKRLIMIALFVGAAVIVGLGVAVT
jgi:syntaxin 1B/2/3